MLVFALAIPTLFNLFKCMFVKERVSTTIDSRPILRYPSTRKRGHRNLPTTAYFTVITIAMVTEVFSIIALTIVITFTRVTITALVLVMPELSIIVPAD